MQLDFSRSFRCSALILAGVLALIAGCSSPSDNHSGFVGTDPAAARRQRKVRSGNSNREFGSVLAIPPAFDVQRVRSFTRTCPARCPIERATTQSLTISRIEPEGARYEAHRDAQEWNRPRLNPAKNEDGPEYECASRFPETKPNDMTPTAPKKV